MNAIHARLKSPTPKRILALDGGGIRGVTALGYLARLERLLRDRSGRRDLRLCDYFDLIGGTSTGAIIAGSLALGREVAEVQRQYARLGGRIFRARSWRLWETMLNAQPLEEGLAEIFGDVQLGDEQLRTGLCIVAQRADTWSPWLLINHPGGRFHAMNAAIPLRQAVRASVAAPGFFTPVQIDVGNGERGVFIDGAISTLNNPALQLFMLATMQGYPFQWATGPERLLLVSIGTGTWDHRQDVRALRGDMIWNWVLRLPQMFIDATSWQNQALLQSLAISPNAWEIDRMMGPATGLLREPLMTYLRYNLRLEADYLNELGCGDVSPVLSGLRDPMCPDYVDWHAKLSAAAAEREISEEHLPRGFDGA